MIPSSGKSAVRVRRILEGSPAARADLHTGDHLVRICGQSIDGLEAAHKAMATIRAGDPVELLIRRHSDPRKDSNAIEQTLTITAGEGL